MHEQAQLIFLLAGWYVCSLVRLQYRERDKLCYLEINITVFLEKIPVNIAVMKNCAVAGQHLSSLIRV